MINSPIFHTNDYKIPFLKVLMNWDVDLHLIRKKSKHGLYFYTYILQLVMHDVFAFCYLLLKLLNEK